MRAGEPVWAGFGVVLCSGVYLDEKIVAIEGALSAVDIPHAFGGANAFAYDATPRATVDIDVKSNWLNLRR